MPATPRDLGNQATFVSFRSTSWDLFLQDDWRVRDTITVNAGLRYEYFSPLSEANNHLETLDAASGFAAAAPVAAGAISPYSGLLPDTIVRPFRDGFAPRVRMPRRRWHLGSLDIPAVRRACRIAPAGLCAQMLLTIVLAGDGFALR